MTSRTSPGDMEAHACWSNGFPDLWFGLYPVLLVLQNEDSPENQVTFGTRDICSDLQLHLAGTSMPSLVLWFIFQLFIIRVKPIGESWVISREKGTGKGICKQEELILFLDCLWCSVVMQPTSIYLLSASSLDGWEHVFPSKGLLTCSVRSKTTDLQCFTVSMVTISRLPLSDLRKCASC